MFLLEKSFSNILNISLWVLQNGRNGGQLVYAEKLVERPSYSIVINSLYVYMVDLHKCYITFLYSFFITLFLKHILISVYF